LFGYERGAFTGAQAATTGKLEAATGGTVFFDEVGELSQFAQAKLLRAIDHREIYRLGGNRRFQLDIRVVAATNRDLEAMVRENQFRRDLYFRLNVATVHIPPLRERREDIPALVRHFLPDLNRRFRRRVAGLTSESMEHFLSYDWPGNIRELRNVLEAAFVVTRSSHISWTEMPESFRRTCDRMMPSPPTEREALVNALRASRWNKTEAAGRLHWSRMTLYRKMSKYDVLDNADSDDL
jgi:transcriptional regulator with PAS, ATPase and Fis domain